MNGYVSALFAAQKNQLDPDAPEADHRSVAALRAEALSELCAHALGCENDAPALAGATVVVRVDLKDLADGTGYATIDGSDLPLSIGAARQLAASGGVIPACSVQTARSSTTDAGCGSSPPRSASPSPNATAAVRCADCRRR